LYVEVEQIAFERETLVSSPTWKRKGEDGVRD
jgi:hypothetical protein